MKKSKIIIIISLFLVFTGILHAQTVTVTPETPSSQKQETTQNKDSEKEETKIQKEKRKDPFIHEPFLFFPVLNFYGGNVDYLALDVGVEILKYPFFDSLLDDASISSDWSFGIYTKFGISTDLNNVSFKFSAGIPVWIGFWAIREFSVGYGVELNTQYDTLQFIEASVRIIIFDIKVMRALDYNSEPKYYFGLDFGFFIAGAAGGGEFF